MNTPASFDLSPIGFVRSILKERSLAPHQGWQGAPDAQLEFLPAFLHGLEGLQPGQEIWIFTWLHQSQRSTLKVHPRGDSLNALKGVFATRSPDRPNPIGMHRSKILSIENGHLQVEALEAIDGTPVIDLKPVLEPTCIA